MNDKMLLASGLLLGLAVFLAAPALIALVRRHPERRLIYKLTPLTLLSFLLWLALLVWAASDKRDDAVISRYVGKLRAGKQLPLAIGLLVLVGVAASALTVMMR